MTAVSSSTDGFKMETLVEISRTDGFDDIRPARPVTEEQDYHSYDLISVCLIYVYFMFFILL